jgi:signal transduction histidine kinase
VHAVLEPLEQIVQPTLSFPDCRILVVDDDEANTAFLLALLEDDGYRHVVSCRDPRMAVELYGSFSPDLVLLDLHMPHLSGFAVMNRLAELREPDEFLPILVLTADVNPDSRLRALGEGAIDFLTKPLNATEVTHRVRNLLAARVLHQQQHEGWARAEVQAATNARLYDEAERATRARDRVLAVVAHDLRNPLNTIVMAADMMLEHADPADVSSLGMVRRAAMRMNEMIEDLLEVTRLERGRSALDLSWQSIPALLAEAVAMLRPLATARGITLEEESDHALPPIMADPRRLLQALSNLVGNAVKFTGPGGLIRISCSLEKESVHFAVADTGQGIAPDQLPHLFDTFWQATAHDRRGIGLGLCIAKSIVDAHGGDIRVESEVAVGSTFHFTIPVGTPGAAIHSSVLDDTIAQPV